MPERTKAQKAGDRGESAAAAFLQKHGYTVREKNYRTKFGEIDIIAENDEYIVFAEVKTRAVSSFERPVAAVDRKKQKRLIKTALLWLDENDTEKAVRFDVVEVVYDNITGVIIDVSHIVEAFTLRDSGELYF